MCIGGAFRSFGSGSVIDPPVRLHGVESITIGKDVFIGPNSTISFLDNTTVKNGQGIVIGDSVKIFGGCVLSAVKSIVLEESVLLGGCVHIADHRHEFDDISRPVMVQGLTEIAPVVIKSGAWIGQGVVICPGVTIGRNAVIGANSVVRYDVPNFCLAAGAPARIIRRIGVRIPVSSINGPEL
jgi:acetyltransferase-like isoleucine patch superfamily enzyme